jgi:uncharacterized paraquat-inducible protein A
MENDTRCTACDMNRSLCKIEPAAKTYEIRWFECPRCSSILRMAHRRPRVRARKNVAAVSLQA